MNDVPPVLVTIRHARALHYCWRGTLPFLQRHAWSEADIRRFVLEGVEPELLERTGDAQALALVACARAEHARLYPVAQAGAELAP